MCYHQLMLFEKLARIGDLTGLAAPYVPEIPARLLAGPEMPEASQIVSTQPSVAINYAARIICSIKQPNPQNGDRRGKRG